MKFMKCPNCNKEIQENSNFCSNCGVKLEVLIACGNSSCPDYGKKILPSDSRFCPTCGGKIKKAHGCTSDSKNSKKNKRRHKKSINNPQNSRAYYDDSLIQRVCPIIVDILGVDESEVISSARFVEELGADELDMVELIIEFEKEFCMSISDEDAQAINTVGDALDYISKWV